LTEIVDPFELVTHTVMIVGSTTIRGVPTVIVGNGFTTMCLLTGPCTTTFLGQGVPSRMMRRRHGLVYTVRRWGGPIHRPTLGPRETTTDGRWDGRAVAVVPDSSLKVPVNTAPRTIIDTILCRIIVLPFH
jgi:hypothetical protein